MQWRANCPGRADVVVLPNDGYRKEMCERAAGPYGEEIRSHRDKVQFLSGLDVGSS